MAKRYSNITKNLNHTFGKYDFECDIDKLIEKLQTLKSNYSKYPKLEFKIEHTYQYNDESFQYVLEGTRKETDKEREKRLENKKKERNKKRQALVERDEKERLLYEQLKAKFEG